MAPVRSESSGHIDASPEAVYAYLSDVSRWPEWADAIQECSISGGGPVRSGARIDQQVAGRGGSTKGRTLDVVAVEVPRRIEFAGTHGASPLRWGFDLTPIDGRQTDLLLWVEMDRRGPMRALPAQMLRKMVRETNNREISTIKSKVEGQLADD